MIALPSLDERSDDSISDGLDDATTLASNCLAQGGATVACRVKLLETHYIAGCNELAQVALPGRRRA